MPYSSMSVVLCWSLVLDVHMHLNQGLFRLNEGCGYILKPKVMRLPNQEVEFDPRMTTPHPDVTPVNLEIEASSA